MYHKKVLSIMIGMTFLKSVPIVQNNQFDNLGKGNLGTGAWGLVDVPSLRNSTPCRRKGSPLCTVLRFPFLASDPENFLKAPLAPI